MDCVLRGPRTAPWQTETSVVRVESPDHAAIGAFVSAHHLADDCRATVDGPHWLGGMLRAWQRTD
jgi:hypothetical protein